MKRPASQPLSDVAFALALGALFFAFTLALAEAFAEVSALTPPFERALGLGVRVEPRAPAPPPAPDFVTLGFLERPGRASTSAGVHTEHRRANGGVNGAHVTCLKLRAGVRVGSHLALRTATFVATLIIGRTVANTRAATGARHCEVSAALSCAAGACTREQLEQSGRRRQDLF